MGDEINMLEYQRCLMYFTAEIFKFKPRAKYDVLPFEKKLDLVLEWAEKLDAKKKMRKSGAGMMIKSNAFKHMDERRAKAELLGSPDTPKDGSLFFNNQNSMAHYHTMTDPYAEKNGGGSRWGDDEEYHTDTDHHSQGTHTPQPPSHRSSLGSWSHDEIHDVDLSSLAKK